jgi:hypothetical protein
MILDVITDQAAQVPFIQRDDVIERLTAATSDPSFCGSVLPGRRTPVRFGLSPVAFRKATTLASKIESRSRIT